MTERDLLSRNLLLRSLPPTTLERLQRHFRMVELAEAQVVFQSETRNDVFFPIDSVISLLREFPEGTTIEVSMVGAEGMAGINALFGVPESPHVGLAQGRGLAARIAPDIFHAAVQDHPALQTVMMRYAHVMLMQTSQLAACNRWHVVTERLAHWLLLLHDRVASDEMSLTQEFLARMLATRRAGINVAMRELKETGAIEHRRNLVTIVSRPALEEQCCGCYDIMVDDYRKTLGFFPRLVSRETNPVRP